MSLSFFIDLFFIIAAFALITLDGLLAATVVSTSFKLWPTPSSPCWQAYTFWPLFRGGLGLTLIYALLTVQAPAAQAFDLVRFGLGLMAAGFGFGFLIYGYFDLGLGNTYGSNDGLVTGGLYRYSRNPQYVASILGFLGVALAHGGTHAVFLCSLSVLVYIIMPFTEEPWLEAHYGATYINYKARTPRFL